MTIEQAAAEAQAVVDRARSLFGPSPEPITPAGEPLESAAESTAGVGQRAAGLSGALIDQHNGFVGEQTRDLSSAGRTDTTLESHLAAAATLTQTGARQLDAIAAQTRTIAQAAATARTPAAQRTVLDGLRSQVSQANAIVASTQQQGGDLAGQIRALTYGPGGHTHPAGFGPGGAPQTPPPPDPPHGKDPRYWLDLDKLKYVPPGQLAPYGYKQVGPNLYYPVPDSTYNYEPPLDPAKHPLDYDSILRIPPGSSTLPPYGYKELAPGTGFYAPNPSGYIDGPPDWPTPKVPIDIRDLIQVPPGQLAPRGYIEYLPGWFTPGPLLSNTPNLPQVPR